MTTAIRQGCTALSVRRGGSGDITYLLLHGLGATGEVWQGLTDLIDRHNAGRWLAPDLRGHGRSAWGAPYTYESLADDLMPLIKDSGRVVVVGHSMGGVIALVLGGSQGNIEQVIGVGIKTRWRDEELARMQDLAERPVRWLATREEAVERYLKVSGLVGLVKEDSLCAQSGVATGDDDRYRLSTDPGIYAIGEPPVATLVSAARCQVLLAAGEHDAMAGVEDLKAIDPAATILSGLGHNAQVEDPAALWSLLSENK